MEEDNKPKKKFYKKWWFWALVVVVFIIVASGGGEDQTTTKPEENNTVAAQGADTGESTQAVASNTDTNNTEAAATPDIETYRDGQYKVGTDVSAGEYVLIGMGAYFEIAKDSTGNMDSILANDTFNNRSIVTIKDGQYLKLVGCTMYKMADAPEITADNNMLPEGMYKVGSDLEAGEYKVIPDGDGYIEVAKDSLHLMNSIITNDSLTGEQYITLKDGQYIKLVSASLKIK